MWLRSARAFHRGCALCISSKCAGGCTFAFSRRAQARQAASQNFAMCHLSGMTKLQKDVQACSCELGTGSTVHGMVCTCPCLSTLSIDITGEPLHNGKDKLQENASRDQVNNQSTRFCHDLCSITTEHSKMVHTGAGDPAGKTLLKRFLGEFVVSSCRHMRTLPVGRRCPYPA